MADYNLGTARGVIQIDYNGKGTTAAQQGLQGVGNQAQQTGTLMKAAGFALTGAATAVAGGLAYAAKSAMDFEQRMSAVKAVSGASAADMQKLSDKALQIGKDTSFSATQAADAIGELAKAGVAIPDIMNGAADATVALAAAGEIDLPQAATIASNAMNQFGLAAADLPNVANKIAGAANASAIDVSDFGMSMSQAGAVANLAGMTFDDLTVAIAEMGNAGIKGSDAGTSLKAMLSMLQPTTKSATTAMSELGLIAADGSNQFYDQTGKLKSLRDIQDLLGKSLAGLTQEQQQMALKTIFGSDAIRAAAILAGNGATGFDQLAASIGKTSAADVAATRLDNVSGAIEQFKGSVETVAIQIGTLMIPMLRGIADSATGVVNTIGDMAPQIISAISGIVAFLAKGDFTGGLGKLLGVEEDSKLVDTLFKLRDAVATAIGNIIGFVKDVAASAVNLGATFAPLAAEIGGALVIGFGLLSNVLKPVGAALVAVTGFLREHKTIVTSVVVAIGTFVAIIYAYNAAMIITAAITNAVRIAILAFKTAMFMLNIVMRANPIGLIITAILALVAGLIYAYKHSEKFRAVVDAVWKAIKTAVTVAISAIVATVKTVWAKIQDWVIDPIKSAWSWLVDIWNRIYAAVSNAVSMVVGFVKDHWQLLLAIILGPLGLVIDAVVTHWDWIKSTISGAIDWIVSFVQGAWGKFKDWIINPIVAAYNGVVTWITAIVTWINTKIAFIVMYLQAVWANIWATITTVWNSIYTTISGIITTIVDWIVNKWNLFVLGLQIIWDTVSSAISTTWNNIYAFFSGIITTIVDWITGKWNDFVTGLQFIWDTISSAASAAWESIKSTIMGLVQPLIDFFNSKFGWVRDFISGIWNTISSTASTVWETVKTTVTTAINNIVTTITGIGTTIKNAFSSALTWLVDAGKNIVTGLWNGISGAAGWIMSQITGFVSSIKDNVLGFFGIKSPSRMFMWIGEMLMRGFSKGIDDNAVLAVRAVASMGSDVRGSVLDSMRTISGLGSTVSLGARLTAGQSSSSLSGAAAVSYGNARRPADGGATAAGSAVTYDIDVYNPPQPTTESMVLAAIGQTNALYPGG